MAPQGSDVSGLLCFDVPTSPAPGVCLIYTGPLLLPQPGKLRVLFLPGGWERTPTSIAEVGGERARDSALSSDGGAQPVSPSSSLRNQGEGTLTAVPAFTHMAFSHCVPKVPRLRGVGAQEPPNARQRDDFSKWGDIPGVGVRPAARQDTPSLPSTIRAQSWGGG